MKLHTFLRYKPSLNRIFAVVYYVTISYNTVNSQNLAIFSSKDPNHYTLIKNTNIMIIDQMRYQMICNDERNNFSIQHFFSKYDIYTYFCGVLVKFDQI